MKTLKKLLEELDSMPPAHIQMAPKKNDDIGNLIKSLNKQDEMTKFIHKHVIEPHKQFTDFIKRTFDYEGKGGEVTHDTGGLTKYGISQKSNPDVDIHNLTPEKAMDIYKERYYDKLGHLGNFSKKSRAIIYDASVNHGPNFAKKLMKNVGNDPDKLLQARKNHYDSLVKTNPEKYGMYHKGWINRLDRLKQDIQGLE
jgi:lysozyme family protein